MKKIISFLLSSILLGTTLTGCSKKENTISSDYSVAVVYTSTDKESSIIQVYDENGIMTDKSNLNVGGINLANFYKSPIKHNEKVYYTMPVLGNKSQDFIIEINQEDLSYNKIHNLNKKGVTSFDVTDTDAFLSISDLTNTDVTKISLSDFTKNHQKSLEGSCKFTISDEQTLYMFNNIGESTMRIYEVSADDFTELSYIDIEDVTFVTDALVLNHTLYFLVNRDGKDMLSNRLIKFNLSSKKVDEILLPFENLSKIYTDDDYLYIIENSYNGSDETQNRIAKVDIETEKVQIFKANNIHLATDVKDKKLYSTNGQEVYIYDLSNLELLDTFALEQEVDKVVTSIFTK